MAFAMIKKQNKCTVWYYISYCSRCLGELEVLRSIFYCYNDTLLPPPLAMHQYLKSIPLKITLSLA